jgi:UDP-glucuronate decarboxylase
MPRNKTIIITGATGLIGRHLVATAPPGDIFQPSHIDLTDFKEFPKADIIIHAAGYAQPSRFMADPVGTLKINTAITGHLLMHLNPGGSFLFCSSTEVYNGLTHPAKEEEIGTTNPQHIRSCYIEGKRCGEAIVGAYRHKGYQAASARIGHTYGPGAKVGDTRVMSQLIEQALLIGKIELRDSGSAVRTLCYVSDTARMLWDIALRGTQEVYNVGGESVISIWGLTQMIANKTGCQFSSTISTAAEMMDIGAPSEVRIDLTRIQKEFGKKSYINLDEGLDHTINWYRSLIHGV